MESFNQCIVQLAKLAVWFYCNSFMLPLNPDCRVFKISNNIYNITIMFSFYVFPLFIRVPHILPLWIAEHRRFTRRRLIRQALRMPAEYREEQLAKLELKMDAMFANGGSGLTGRLAHRYYRFRDQYKYDALKRLRSCRSEDFTTELLYLGYIDAGREMWETHPDLLAHLKLVLASWDQQEQHTDEKSAETFMTSEKQPFFAELELLRERGIAEQEEFMRQNQNPPPAWKEWLNRFTLDLFPSAAKLAKFPDYGPDVKTLRWLTSTKDQSEKPNPTGWLRIFYEVCMSPVCYYEIEPIEYVTDIDIPVASGNQSDDYGMVTPERAALFLDYTLALYVIYSSMFFIFRLLAWIIGDPLEVPLSDFF